MWPVSSVIHGLILALDKVGSEIKSKVGYMRHYE